MKIKKTKKEQITDKIVFLENLGKQRAKELKQNRTKWEIILYNTLKELHFKFQFQVPIVVNKLKAPQLFIIDFLLTDFNIFIEADGKSTHGSKEQIRKDNRRSKLLLQEGLHPIRLFNSQITRFTKEEINTIIQQRIYMLNTLKF